MLSHEIVILKILYVLFCILYILFWKINKLHIFTVPKSTFVLSEVF